MGCASYEPVLLETAENKGGERFTYLKDYSFSDEGDKVKVYVSLPAGAHDVVKKDSSALEFEFEKLDVKYRGPDESFRLLMEPMYGTIEVSECKHRASKDSPKVTLTLKKRHKHRIWTGLMKTF